MSMIRPATSADLLPLCTRLAPLPLFQRYGHTPERLNALLARALERQEPVVVYADPALQGFAWFLPAGSLGMGGYLRLIAVAPDIQTQGVGRALLTEFERQTFSQSAHALLLVSDFNTDAQRFYERHGYVRTGAFPGLVLADVAELLYWKRRPG